MKKDIIILCTSCARKYKDDSTKYSKVISNISKKNSTKVVKKFKKDHNGHGLIVTRSIRQLDEKEGENDE